MPVTCSRLVALSYCLLAVTGLVPVLNTCFGLAPVCDGNVILHVALAAVATCPGLLPDARGDDGDQPGAKVQAAWFLELRVHCTQETVGTAAFAAGRAAAPFGVACV
jgi:hypothetical protein